MIPFVMNSSSKTKRIVLSASTLTAGGAEKIVESLALHLPEYGYEIDIVCLKEAGKIGEELQSKGVNVLANIMRGSFDPFVPLRLSRMFTRRKYDLFFSIDHHNSIFLGAVASLFAGVKHRVFAVHSTGLWGKGSSFSAMDRIVIPLYERIVALGENHRRTLIEKEHIAPEKIAVINNGVDTSLFKPRIASVDPDELKRGLGIPRDNIVVSIVAALRPEKNHEMFLRAAKMLLERKDSFTFLIVGDGEERKRLEIIKDQMALGDSVKFLGLRKDVENILSITDIGVLCSFPVVETFPVSVLEAMSCGIPVIVTRVGSVEEIVEDKRSGILIDSGDFKALAEKIEKLASDSDLRYEIGKRARERVVKRFSLEKMLKGYAGLFDGLLKST